MALNGVIPMQPEFVAQRESVDPSVLRGPGGVPIILDRPRDTRGEMTSEDIVTSGTVYKPEIVSHLAGQIKKNIAGKWPEKIYA